MDQYIESSLELHLFFGRIMKEHALVLRAGFTPANPSFSQKAEFYKNGFEDLLCQAVALSDGIVEKSVLCSGEIVTEFTAMAEQQTKAFTGISIDKAITAEELQLCHGRRRSGSSSHLREQIRQLNEKALRLLDGLICFKELILKNVLSCRMFTMNYPLLIEHILREAKLYRQYVEMLERDGCLRDSSMRQTECFWNQIMMEHAQFIRGLLDPVEAELIHTADGFAQQYAQLLSACHDAQSRTMPGASLNTTVRFRDFKRAGVEGIEACGIRSVILPLLADHVLREANHYIRLLTVFR